MLIRLGLAVRLSTTLLTIYRSAFRVGQYLIRVQYSFEVLGTSSLLTARRISGCQSVLMLGSTLAYLVRMVYHACFAICLRHLGRGGSPCNPKQRIMVHEGKPLKSSLGLIQLLDNARVLGVGDASGSLHSRSEGCHRVFVEAKRQSNASECTVSLEERRLQL